MEINGGTSQGRAEAISGFIAKFLAEGGTFMEFDGWNRILFATSETARVVYVLVNLGNLLPGAPANRFNLNLKARAGDVQFNWPQQIKLHVGGTYDAG